nr:hypothetical protein [Tanacetum cinerariifolium]
MLVQQQAADDTANIVANDVDDVVVGDTVEPSPPLPIPTTTPPPPQDIPSTSQVAPTPPPSPIAQPSPPQQQPSQPTTVSMDLLHTLLETCTALIRRVENLEQDKVAQALEITKLKQRVKRLEKKNKLKVSGGCIQTGGIIDLLDVNEDVTLEEVAANVNAAKDAKVAEDADDDETKPAELQEVIEVVTTAKLMTEVVTAATTTITAAPITVATIINAPSDAKRKKGLEEEVSKALKRTSESQEEKAAKKQKLDEEVEELKKHLQIIPNDDDDVYTEATPLALKVPVVDYESISILMWLSWGKLKNNWKKKQVEH